MPMMTALLVEALLQLVVIETVTLIVVNVWARSGGLLVAVQEGEGDGGRMRASTLEKTPVMLSAVKMVNVCNPMSHFAD